MAGPRPRGLAAFTAAPPASLAWRIVLGVTCAIGVGVLLMASVGVADFYDNQINGCGCDETLPDSAFWFATFAGVPFSMWVLAAGALVRLGLVRIGMSPLRAALGAGVLAGVLLLLTIGAYGVATSEPAINLPDVGVSVAIVTAAGVIGAAIWLAFWAIIRPRTPSCAAEVFA